MHSVNKSGDLAVPGRLLITRRPIHHHHYPAGVYLLPLC
jgi:hypothetical protein